MTFRKLFPFALALTFALKAVPTNAQTVLISEFMASNHRGLLDEDNTYPDWIELYNPGATPVNLDGWYLTDNASLKTKWRIPAVTLGSKQFKIIFASDKNRIDPSSNLHTNFKIAADGEYLGLILPDGVTPASEYAPAFPPQQEDVSYGMTFNGSTKTVIAPGATAWAVVPSNNSLGTSWTEPLFNHSAWASGTTAVGYETSSGYQSLIGLNLRTAMYNVNTSAYIRIPFTVTNTSAINQVTLRMKYDDGFVAWINGTRVASAAAPETLVYDSAATDDHPDSQALQYVDYDITAFASALQPGTNVLAIQGMNTRANSSDFLILPELSVSDGTGIEPNVFRYFTAPTPGQPNGSSAADKGPVISEVVHTPNQPTAGQNLQVTARITPQAAPLSTATLTYRVHFGANVTIPLYDDGDHGDGGSADGVYGCTIPMSAYTSGQMVRYYISVMDSDANTARYPLFPNPTASPEYAGTMVIDPNVSTSLPVLYWFIANPSAAATEVGTQCSVFYNGVLYDNIGVELRGQTSASWPKHHYKFNMNGGFDFVYDSAQGPVEEFNLQSTFSDKSYIRSILAWETYAAAGVPYCFNFPVRVQQNGAFFSVASIMEQPGTDYLNRNDLDEDGALYKMYSDASNDSGVEKKTRQSEDNADLLAFIAGLTSTGTALKSFMFDNVNVPEQINYLAATCIVHDNDHVGKNYFLYRDSDGSQEWYMLPWDKDLTFGRNFVPWDGGVLSDTIWANTDPYSHPFFGDQQHPKVDGPWNRVIDALLREPTIRAMYVRRLRTLMDQQLQPPLTPAQDLKFEARINSLVSLISQDVVLDRAKWGNPYGVTQDLASAIALMKTGYLAPRRRHLYNTYVTSTGLIPGPQTPNPVIRFGTLEWNPASENQDEEYITIINDTNDTVDISGWTLSGDVSFTFAPGTVLPALGTAYVSPNLKTFRARSSAPTGGMGLFVLGEYKGHLSSADAVTLKNASGTAVAVSGVQMSDVTSVLSIAGGLEQSTVGQKNTLNVEPDGVLDILDATRLIRRVVGLEP